jgi:hypothetical protein
MIGVVTLLSSKQDEIKSVYYDEAVLAEMEANSASL